MSEAQKLKQFIAASVGSEHLKVEEQLGSGYVRLLVSEAERRQAAQDIRCVEDALLEALRNARDAGASHIFVATGKEQDKRSFVVLDDGAGIPSELHERIFEARVTSKLTSAHEDAWGFHGRGMALFSIKSQAEAAKILTSEPGKGTSFAMSFDLSKVPEKADQSSWPELVFSERPEASRQMPEPQELSSPQKAQQRGEFSDSREWQAQHSAPAPGRAKTLPPHLRRVSTPESAGLKAIEPETAKLMPESPAQSMRGPHNIARLCCEFALQEKDSCQVYLGSISEIAATLADFPFPHLGIDELLFIEDPQQLKVVERLKLASDAGELARIAATLGLSLSERTAFRIFSHAIKPVRPVLDYLKKNSSQKTASDRRKAYNGVKSPQSTAKLSEESSASLFSREFLPKELLRDGRGLKLSPQDADEFVRELKKSFSLLEKRYYVQLSGEPKLRLSADHLTVRFDIEKLD